MIDQNLRSGGAYRLDRLVGTACGIAIEVWRRTADDEAILAATPTIHGFTILAQGVGGDVDFLGVIGTQMLCLLRTTGPLLTGSHFRDDDGRTMYS